MFILERSGRVAAGASAGLEGVVGALMGVNGGDSIPIGG